MSSNHPRCLWTGQSFPPATNGGAAKKFASASARHETHTAARLYTETMIAEGFLSWETLRAWYDRRNAAPAPCTAEGATETAPPPPEATNG